MKLTRYRDAVVAWALALPRGKGGPTAAGPIAAVVERFGLSATERRIVELCYAAERSVDVAAAIQQAPAARGGGLTVEQCRLLLGDELVDGALGPLARLRAHGLVQAGEAGPVWAS